MEIIFVDDGSDDNTFELISDLKNEEIKLLKHSANLGIMSAMLSGIKECTKDFILFLPGDFTYGKKTLLDFTEVFGRIDNLNSIILGVRSKSRIKRSIIREFSAMLARLPLVIFNFKLGIIPNYGLICIAKSQALKIPNGIGSYANAIGILGTALKNCENLITFEINPIPGSENRSAKLDLKKVKDILFAYLIILKII